MKKAPFLVVTLLLLFTVGCAQQGKRTGRTGLVKNVRTTAYAACEGSSRNAIGGRLSSGSVKSAASDWSRYPLGTKFKIVSTGETYRIDDYGSALVGTDTIDLFKPSRGSMNRWGVRHVDINILEWGSSEKSLQVLAPRRAHYVRAMTASLRKQNGNASRRAETRRAGKARSS